MSNKNGNPYLSIVIASRNDDHGGNALQRMQVSLNGRLEQLEKHRIESKLVLVEWIPPADKPLLKDIIRWPGGLRYCTTRVIAMPPTIHRRYEGHDKRPIHSVNINHSERKANWVCTQILELIVSANKI